MLRLPSARPSLPDRSAARPSSSRTGSSRPARAAACPASGPAAPGGLLRASLAAAAFAALPLQALACACGCGVFEVGTGSLFPSGAGGVVYLGYDYMNQNTNWSGTSSASPDNNGDKGIRTQFWNLGANYMFDRDWGVMVQVPYVNRSYTTDANYGASPQDIQQFNSRSMGDIRVQAMYTGFSPDMSTGLTFGLKLPTGTYTAPGFDRDTQIGSGSTDLLLGAYHLGSIDADGNWTWFVQGLYDHAVATRATTDPDSGLSLDYRPGDELDAAGGISYSFGQVGVFSKVALIGQAKASYRMRDTGGAADNLDSGYTRVLLAPGIEADIGAFRLYAEVATPVYQKVNGEQLTAKALTRIILSYSF